MTTLAHVGETKIDDGSPPLDRSHQVFEHGRPPVELDPLPLSGGTLLGVALEAFVEFGEASGERRAPLVEAGSPNANVGAQRTDRGGPLLDFSACGGEPAPGFERGFLGCLKFGQLGLEFSDPGRFAFETHGEFIETSLQRVGLGADLTSIGVGALQGIGGGTQPLLDAGEPLSKLVSSGRTLSELAPGVGRGISGGGADHSSALNLLFGFGERRTRGAGAGRPDAPTASAEPIASERHDDLAGAGECLIERDLPAAVNGDRIGEQHVEQIVDRRIRARDVASHELGPIDPGTRAATEGKDGASGNAGGEFGERETGRLGAVDNHGRTCVTDSGLEGGFPAHLDLDEVEQGAEHAVDRGEMLRAAASAGLIESKGQCLGAGDPTMVIGLGIDLLGLAGGDLLLRHMASGLGRLVGRNERLLFVVESGKVGSSPGGIRFEILTLLLKLGELRLKAV